MARIVEYTHDPVPQVVFDLSFWILLAPLPRATAYYCYRSHRIPDLYAHPAEPVTDLAIYPPNSVAAQVGGGGNGAMQLEFSADPTFNYEVQSSTDLTNWTTIGTAWPDGGPGNFGFNDLSASQFTTRFYRVVTQ